MSLAYYPDTDTSAYRCWQMTDTNEMQLRVLVCVCVCLSVRVSCALFAAKYSIKNCV